MDPKKIALAKKLDVIMAMSCIVNDLSKAASMAYLYGFLEIEAEVSDILSRTVADTQKLCDELTNNFEKG